MDGAGAGAGPARCPAPIFTGVWPRTVDVALYQIPGEPRSACVFVKRTYDLFHGRRMYRSRSAEWPLNCEPVGEDAGGTEPVECPMSEWDLAPRKPCTDIIVHGHVRSPGAVPVTSMRAAVRIGEGWKHALVIGDRRVSWRPRSTLSFGPPEPFVELLLTWRRTYGGVDGSVPPRGSTTPTCSIFSPRSPRVGTPAPIRVTRSASVGSSTAIEARRGAFRRACDGTCLCASRHQHPRRSSLGLGELCVALMCAELLDAWLLRRQTRSHVLAVTLVGLIHVVWCRA